MHNVSATTLVHFKEYIPDKPGLSVFFLHQFQNRTFGDKRQRFFYRPGSLSDTQLTVSKH